MIEIVYNDNMPEEENNHEIRVPKNVKQIGEGNGKRKIYIEDYVMNFLKTRPQKEVEDACTYGVLLGTIEKNEENTYLFVRGAVEAKGPLEQNEETAGEYPFFEGDCWNHLYEDIKHYFDSSEIIGWYLIKKEISAHEMPLYNKVHLGNFTGLDKIFLTIEQREHEVTAYCAGMNGLEQEDTFFIYYDRNDAMQQYMNGSMPAKVEEEKNEKKETKTISFSVSSAATVAALLALVLLLNGSGSFSRFLQSFQGTEAIGTLKPVGQTISSTTTEPTTQMEETSTATEEPSTEATVGVDVRYYTVQAGETLYEICMRVYGNSSMVDTVREKNGINEDYLIQEGQKIILP